jgi:hypothetical protein
MQFLYQIPQNDVDIIFTKNQQKWTTTTLLQEELILFYLIGHVPSSTSPWTKKGS